MAGIEPDIELPLDRREGSVNELVTQVMSRFGDALGGLIAEHNPPGHPPGIPLTLVHGDTSTALAGALASTFLGIPVVHIEAGLRTYDLHGPFPEELNRQLIARTAVLSIAPTGQSEGNLIREAIDSESVFVSGNTGIDALLWAIDQPVEFADERLSTLMSGGDPFIVVTAHRRENWDRLDGIAQALLAIAEARPDLHIVLPLHPNPRVGGRLRELLEGHHRLILTDPMPYIEFAHLLRGCRLALTDSGGIQEEAPSLGIPVLVMRDETERPEGVLAGTLMLVGSSPDRIAEATLGLLEDHDAYARMRQAENPYGDGRAAERIVQALRYAVDGGQPPTPFGPGFSRLAVVDTPGRPR